MSLVETLIVAALLMVVVGTSLTVLTSFQANVSKADQRSQTNDQARLAVQSIDRLTRSGNVLYDPALEGSNAGSGVAAGFSLRIYTQANGNERCVQWRVRNGNLETRAWSTNWVVDNDVTAWHTAALGIANPPSQPPFALDGSKGFGGRLLNVDFLVNVQSSLASGADVQASVEGRNTLYGYDPSVCNTIPVP
jgi:hypothetical protein